MCVCGGGFVYCADGDADVIVARASGDLVRFENLSGDRDSTFAAGIPMMAMNLTAGDSITVKLHSNGSSMTLFAGVQSTSRISRYLPQVHVTHVDPVRAWAVVILRPHCACVPNAHGLTFVGLVHVCVLCR